MIHRRLALLALCAGALMMILDETIVNVALPVIQRDLAFSATGLAWIVNAYLIAFGGLLLLAGRLGDLLGRRRVFLAGLSLFTAASVLCGLAQTQAMLIGARFLQGAGGALASAVILGMIVTLFPRPGERAQAIGVFSFTQAAGGSIGLLVGGLVTDTLGWHWIFFVNVPIAGLVAAGVLRFVPAQAGLLADGTTRARSALVPRRLLRNRALWTANLVQAIAIAGLFGIQFLGGLYLQRVLGYTPLQQGLAFLPLVVGIAALSLGVSGRVITRFGAARVLVPGLALIAAGLAYLARGPLDGTYVADVLPAMVVLGVGGGLALPALMTLAMAAATDADAGLASGLATTTQQVGGALGLTLVAELAAHRAGELRAAGADAAHALTAGFHLGFAVGSALVLTALLLAVVLLWGQISRSAWRRPGRSPARSSRTSP